MKYQPKYIAKIASGLILMHGIIFSQDVSVKVSTNKSIYLTGEPIWLEIEFSNLSSDTFDLHPAYWSIYLIDEEGNRVPKTLFIDWGISKWNPNFVPGGLIDYFKELTGEFGKTRDSSFIPILPVLPVGNYNLYIKGKTKSRYDIVKKMRKRANFKSNEVEFEVRDPIGLELEVYDLLRLGKQKRSTHQLSEAEEIYQRIIDNYPQSVYSVKTSYFFALMYKHSQQESKKILSYKRFRELMQKHPDSYYSDYGLRSAVQLNSSLDIEDEFLLLEEIINLYPDTKVSKKAVELLESLDNENNVRE